MLGAPESLNAVLIINTFLFYALVMDLTIIWQNFMFVFYDHLMIRIIKLLHWIKYINVGWYIIFITAF